MARFWEGLQGVLAAYERFTNIIQDKKISGIEHQNKRHDQKIAEIEERLGNNLNNSLDRFKSRRDAINVTVQVVYGKESRQLISTSSIQGFLSALWEGDAPAELRPALNLSKDSAGASPSHLNGYLPQQR